ncbi:YafY family protein [Nesterenkonia sp. Act20]|uniref:helix-turn-helix transcriptional regulator n=1 Tax=Nesterenkonia sp. Act20 TaxID=1483432 RepID=UPI001C453E1E|nr:WYL domain-containing protein [Nesterenkonia sp. Act20]
MSGSTFRTLTLLSLLQTQRDWPGQLLADRLEVTARTVRRDVERLRELGYEIRATKGPDGGYRLVPGSELPPLRFDDDQAVAIAVALQSAPSSGVEIEEGAERALATVRQVMPARLRHRIDGVRFTVPRVGSPVNPAVLESVSAAVRERRVLRFDYREQAPRRTQPHAIVARRGRWYLIGWDLDRTDWRIYRVDRMTPRVPPGPLFTPRPLPAPNPASFLAARFKGSELDDQWPCIGEIILELPLREIAPWIDDGKLHELSETSTHITLGSWSWQGVLALIARFDAPFKILGPEELTVAAKSFANRLSESPPHGA